MIDEKGRLFGKVNVVDLLIALVLVAALVFVGLKVFAPKSNGEAKPAILTLYCTETGDFVADKLEKGAVVYDNAEEMNIGTVRGWTLGDSASEIENDYGEVVTYAREGYVSVMLEVDCNGVVGPNGLTVNGTLYGIGHSMVVYAGESKLYLRVYDVGYAS